MLHITVSSVFYLLNLIGILFVCIILTQPAVEEII
jgi:hypothetical protein